MPLDDDRSELKDKFISYLDVAVAEYAMNYSVQGGTAFGGPAGGGGGGGHGLGSPTLLGGGNSGCMPSTAGQQQQQQQSSSGAAPGQQHGASGHAHAHAHGHGPGGGAGGGGQASGLLHSVLCERANSISPMRPTSIAGSDIASANAYDGSEWQPFEMLVLETALAEVCNHLSREAETLQVGCS